MDGTGQLLYGQIPALSCRYRVVTYRLRDAATQMSTLVEDLARVVRHASPGGDPAIVLGESFGGALSLSFALDRPDLVAGLAVLNTFPYVRPQTRLRLAIAAVRAMPWKAMGLVRRLAAFRLHSRYTHRAEIRRFYELAGRATSEGYVNRLRILREYDIRDRLPELGTPTLFLAAERDHIIPSVQQARYMAARVPRSTLRILEGHGHACLLAPNLDMVQILAEWRRPSGAAIAASGGRASR
jgi:pimeloyl-ACP methyl ester carboxylesterase